MSPPRFLTSNMRKTAGGGAFVDITDAAYRHRPRRFAMVRSDGVVARVVVVLYGRAVSDARDASIRAIELPEEPAHPVGKGWTYSFGVFYSPAKENGLGAGMHQVKAKGDDHQ